MITSLRKAVAKCYFFMKNDWLATYHRIRAQWDSSRPFWKYVVLISLASILVIPLVGIILDPHIRSLGRRLPVRSRVELMMAQMEEACGGYFVLYGNFPGTNIREITRNLEYSEQMQFDSALKYIFKKYLFVLPSGEKTIVDPWKRELVVRPAKPWRKWGKSDIELSFIIYSVGPNGIDEHCKGDDIVSRSRSWPYDVPILPEND